MPDFFIVERGQPRREGVADSARVVYQAGGCCIGELFGADEVPAADLRRIDAGRGGDLIHEALHDEDADSHPDAAVGSDRGLVRCHGHGRIGIRREAVRPRHDLRRAHGLEYRGQGVDRIGTAVAGNVGP